MNSLYANLKASKGIMVMNAMALLALKSEKCWKNNSTWKNGLAERNLKR